MKGSDIEEFISRRFEACECSACGSACKKPKETTLVDSRG